jgi:hypothetical protein
MNRRIFPNILIVLLAIALVGSGCATTSSQNAEYKPHKPQMLTSEGVELVGTRKPPEWTKGFELPDEFANILEFFDRLVPRPQEGSGISWR